MQTNYYYNIELLETIIINIRQFYDFKYSCVQRKKKKKKKKKKKEL